MRNFLLVAALATLLLVPVGDLVAAHGESDYSDLFSDMQYRMVGPSRGGRVTAVAGHRAQPYTFYMGATGGGVWKTTDYGRHLVQHLRRLFRHRLYRRHPGGGFGSEHHLRLHRLGRTP